LRSDDERDPFEEVDESPASSSGGVTISGATRAGDLPDTAASDPLLGDAEDWGVPGTSDATELPHWTEAPTGQVPSVLDSSSPQDAKDPWAAVPAPSWREDDADWTADEANFEPSMLADSPLTSAAGDEPTGEIPVQASIPLDDDLTVAGEADADLHEEQIPHPPTRAEQRRQAQASGRRRGDAERRAPRATAPVPAGAAAPRDMRVAILTGLVMAFLVLVTFDLGTVLASLLVLVVVMAAAAEAYAVLRRVGERPATLLGLVATASLLIAVYNRGEVAYPLLTVLLTAASMLWFLVGVERANPVRGVATTLLVFVWVGFFGSFAMLLLNPDHFPNRHGLAFLLGAIVVTVVYDTSALMVGSAIGKRPLAPSVSPGKSWEGAIGGAVIATMASALVVSFIHPWTLGSAIVLGLVVSVVAPMGDLCESMLKRSMGLKDTSTVLPGHGGILDRIDGVLFVLPATYYVVRAFGLG
jgi:phosphatidate cytidylyltransferase